MNFAYVRSLISLILASLAASAAATLGSPAGANAGAEQPAGSGSVTIALLPKGTGLASLGTLEEFAPGLMSAGIGSVPAAQTYLDITQGNRVSESLYDGMLPFVRFSATGVAPVDWTAITERAGGRAGDVVPGLLASMLEREGLASAAERATGPGQLIAANRDGRIEPYRGRCPLAGCPALTVEEVTIAELERRCAGLDGDELLIAIERPPPLFRTLTIGIAGEGFGGLLTSDSTRTNGLVTSTDLAPTILYRLGVPVPDEMNGQPIRSGSERAIAGLIDLERRYEVTGIGVPRW